MFLATIGFRGLRHDGGRGVAALHVTGGGRHRPRSGTTLQTQSCRQGRQRRNQYRDDEFDDLLFTHNR